MPDDQKQILVVDDEENTSDVIKSFLEARSYSVITATSGLEGLNIIKEKNPALVFLDMHMPPLDGIGVLKELKKHNIKSNIYLMTGIDDYEEVEVAKSLGIEGVIKKPVKLVEIYKIVKKCIKIEQIK